MSESEKVKELFEHGFIQEEEYISRLAALGISTPSKKEEKPQSQPQSNNRPKPQQQRQPVVNNTSQFTYVAPPKREEPSPPIKSEPKPIDTKSEEPVKTEKKSELKVSSTPIPMPVIDVPKQIGKTMVFTSSLVIMPPPDQWKAIVDIKKNHMNPRIKRPPFPHITLLQPFLQYRNFGEAKSILTRALKDIPPFRLQFNTFETFENGTSTTLYLDPIVTPSNGLDVVFKVVSGLYPGSTEMSKSGTNFEPHIGVGYFRNKSEAASFKKRYQTGWVPIDFVVKEIYILSRVGEDPFEVRGVVPLSGNTNNVPHFQEKPEY